jgi:hypothetical protein
MTWLVDGEEDCSRWTDFFSEVAIEGGRGEDRGKRVNGGFYSTHPGRNWWKGS